MRLWETGLTHRYHTVPGMEQTVGEHSWGVAIIILQLNPSPSTSLIRAALYHDCAEKFTGDVPATVKWANPGLRKELDEVEERWERSLGIDVQLTEFEKDWLKAADMIELILFCSHAIMLGNEYAREIHDRGLHYLDDMDASRPLPKEVREWLTEYRS